MSSRTIVLHKQTIHTQTLNVINIVQMLMKYATPCRNDPINSFMICKNLTSLMQIEFQSTQAIFLLSSPPPQQKIVRIDSI